MENAVKKTTKALGESPVWIVVGCLPIKIKPITLYQMWEISSILENVDIPEIDEKANAVTEALKFKDMYRVVFDVVICMLFRSKWKRVLLSWYIKKKFTMAHYKDVMTFGFESFGAGFFLGSFIFLKGVKRTAETTRTPVPTHLGDSPEE